MIKVKMSVADSAAFHSYREQIEAIKVEEGKLAKSIVEAHDYKLEDYTWSLKNTKDGMHMEGEPVKTPVVENAHECNETCSHEASN